jgi:hypothetical protein
VRLDQAAGERKAEAGAAREARPRHRRDLGEQAPSSLGAMATPLSSTSIRNQSGPSAMVRTTMRPPSGTCRNALAR